MNLGTTKIIQGNALALPLEDSSVDLICTSPPVDLSHDYCRLAEWRCNDPAQLAAALRVEKPEAIPDGQLSLFGDT